METELFENTERTEKFSTFSRDLLINRVVLLEDECARFVKELYSLRNQEITNSQALLLLEEQLQAMRETMFGASSERYKKPESKDKPKGDPSARIKQPSVRYPNVPVRDIEIAMDPAPGCTSCGKQMVDSGLRESSERLTVIPKKFEIERINRVTYRCCSCQSCMITAAAPKRILEGSSFSDEMILDVVLSKYCDLIPMHRYVAMAARSGVKGLPANSLIELTHGYADFVSPVYSLLRDGVLSSRVTHADETPQRMLEGSDNKHWYLWGFSTTEHCFFECRNTRSGEIAENFLKRAKCEFLVSDAYTGYDKAIREANEFRAKYELVLIKSILCNAHSRRYFHKAFKGSFKEASYYLDQYHEIYQIYDNATNGPPERWPEQSSKLKVLFEAMQTRAATELSSYSDKSQYGKALRYFLGNYQSLTLFLTEQGLPIDNNSQERLLRNHVVGRKTWYGTHSQRGAATAAVLFSIVESCKLNGVNPREYFAQITKDLLAGKKAYTPFDFKSIPASKA
jgi:transposase